MRAQRTTTVSPLGHEPGLVARASPREAAAIEAERTFSLRWEKNRSRKQDVVCTVRRLRWRIGRADDAVGSTIHALRAERIKERKEYTIV